eukprot:UN23942
MLTYVYGLALLNFYFLVCLNTLINSYIIQHLYCFSFVGLRLATLLTDINQPLFLYHIVHVVTTIDSISLTILFSIFLFVCYSFLLKCWL